MTASVRPSNAASAKFDPFEHKMSAARRQLAAHLGVPELPPEWHMRATTPPLDDPVKSFCKDVGIAEPVEVPVSTLPGTEAGWCVRNVRDQICLSGGSIVFGWISWGMPGLMWEAEFHAVWRDTAGDLIDITPKVDGEREICFSPAHEIPTTFDFTGRPGNIRRKAYRIPGLDEKVETWLLAMSEASRRYESARAAKNDVSLEKWIAARIAKLEPDGIDSAVDRFIMLGDRLDTLMKVTPRGTMIRTGIRAGEFERTCRELVGARMKVTLLAEAFLMQRVKDEKMAAIRMQTASKNI